MSSTCRSCGAPIRWAKTAKGRRMPLNALPNPAGNLALDGAGMLVQGALAPPGDRYTSHFVDCPQAKDHRRKQPKETP